MEKNKGMSKRELMIYERGKTEGKKEIIKKFIELLELYDKFELKEENY